MEAGIHRRNRGRGAGLNPESRFEPVELEADPGAEEEPSPTTRFYEDASRSIITRNDSPDIPFSASLNPYRSCEHGCAYCMSGDTPILLANGSTNRLEDLRVGDEIYGAAKRGWYRRYTKTRVLAHWSTVKRAYRTTLHGGTVLVCSGDHRFLTERGWKFVTGAEWGVGRRSHLMTNNKLMETGSFASPPRKSHDSRQGYLCGLIRGDGHLASYNYERAGRSHGDQHQFRLALSDEEALERASRYLLDLEVSTRSFVFQRAAAGRKDVQAIRTSARGGVELVKDLIAWPEGAAPGWREGFLAGIFDAEGSYVGGTLRIANTDDEIIDRTRTCLEAFGFATILEERAGGRARRLKAVRIRGGLGEHLRFFHSELRWS